MRALGVRQPEKGTASDPHVITFKSQTTELHEVTASEVEGAVVYSLAIKGIPARPGSRSARRAPRSGLS
jgi:hypothetical protein